MNILLTDMHKWLSAMSQFLIFFPAAVSLYITARSHMKYTIAKTTTMHIMAILAYSVTASSLHALFSIEVNTLLLLSLVPFYFLYRYTIDFDLSRCLAIYVGVCAIETFPVMFGYAFDAMLYPTSGAADLSIEAALFRFGLSCLLLVAFVYPATRHFSWAVDNLNLPMVWGITVILSSVFFILNVLCIPQHYTVLHTGRLFEIFPLWLACEMIILVSIYVLFYHGTSLIIKNAMMKEQSQLLEMQSHQYQKLKEYIQQTARLRHDFRHSLRIISSLADNGDIDSIRTHLAEYEISLDVSAPINYCSNASLNALFGYYHEMAVSANVDTDWRIELPESLTTTELDMAALFGNLIENAIDGCLTAPEGKRYFCLTTEIRQGNRLYVVSTNSFDGKVLKDKDSYLSTKHSGKGTGLASIAAVAEIYGGSAKVSNSDKDFFVDVVLKI